MLGRWDSCLKQLIAQGGLGSFVRSCREEKREGMEETIDRSGMTEGAGDKQRAWPRVSRKRERDAHQTLPSPEGDS